MNSIKLSMVIGCGLFAMCPAFPVTATPTTHSTPAEAAGDVAKWNKLNRRYLEALLNAGSPITDGVWFEKRSAFWFTEKNGSFVRKSISVTASGVSEDAEPVTVDLSRGTFAEAYGKLTAVMRVTAEQGHVFTVETVSDSGPGAGSSGSPPFQVHITPEALESSNLSGTVVRKRVWVSRDEAIAASQRSLQAKTPAVASSQDPHGYFGEGGRSFAFEIEGSGDELTVRSLMGTWVYRRRYGNVFAYNEHYTLQVVDAEHVIWNPPGQEVDDDPMVYQKMDPTVAKEQIRIGKAAIADVEAEMAATPYTSYEDSGSGDSSASDSPLKATYDALVQANAEAGAHLAQTQAHYDEVMDQAREQAAYERAQAEGGGSEAATGASSQDVANARAATERQYEIERQFNAEQARQAALRVEGVQLATTPPPATESAPAAASSSEQGPRMGFDGRDCAEAQLGAQHWVGTSGTYEIESTQTKPDGWCHIIIKNWHSSGAASFQ